ncbi:leucine-rich repeat receptor-like protein kinase TDR [Argentina anserina]|uniref:leucine-rich repeat receptor-like protein kinase TDR n=1 Tax=Argentina anserina TaxID=57926 RepID=UPI0021768860|nr:leucine-rich repeat receptor-like protein kinase TDR [Potentilla anserina]
MFQLSLCSFFYIADDSFTPTTEAELSEYDAFVPFDLSSVIISTVCSTISSSVLALLDQHFRLLTDPTRPGVARPKFCSLGCECRLDIAVDVASALCYLHGHCEPQIIHRDLKPSNVLLDNDMVARVSDFGLARLIPPTADSSEIQSSTGGVKGTIGYAAPEYAACIEPSKQGDMAIPGRLMQIVDTTLLATLEETAPATGENEVNCIIGYRNDEIEADEERLTVTILAR